MGRKTLIHLALAVLILTGGVSCDRDRDHPGWDFFPNMFYSLAYESWTPNPVFDDGKTMQGPVDGTVPREVMPFQYSMDEREKAGMELENPLLADAAAINRGQQQYSVYCIECHGENGRGDGFLYAEGLYPVKPRSLVNERARSLKDGEIFHTITLGFGSMGAHGSQIRAQDRWTIVSYIREVLQAAPLTEEATE